MLHLGSVEKECYDWLSMSATVWEKEVMTHVTYFPFLKKNGLGGLDSSYWWLINMWITKTGSLERILKQAFLDSWLVSLNNNNFV